MSNIARPIGKFSGPVVAVLGVALLTAGLFIFGDQANPTTVGLIYLLFIVLVATAYESWAALTASVLSTLSFNFFFLPPYHTLNIAEPQNLISLFVFLAVAVTVGQLSAKANRRAAEAERLYAELEDAFEKASEAEAVERSEKLKSALLDAVTHDLRTPLTSIKASVTMLLDEYQQGPVGTTLDSNERGDLLAVINEETDRLNTFIESMVELARIEAGEAQWHRRAVTAEEIVVKAAQRAKAVRLTHKLRSQIEPGLPLISVDPRAVVEALYNLLDNAAKYSPPDTNILIGASKAGAAVRFTVEDEGPGVPESARETVFERFYRNNGASSGLGMGLAIVRGIIEAHGGRIWVETGDKGARFVFELPLNLNGRKHEDPGR